MLLAAIACTLGDWQLGLGSLASICACPNALPLCMLVTSINHNQLKWTEGPCESSDTNTRNNKTVSTNVPSTLRFNGHIRWWTPENILIMDFVCFKKKLRRRAIWFETSSHTGATESAMSTAHVHVKDVLRTSII